MSMHGLLRQALQRPSLSWGDVRQRSKHGLNDPETLADSLANNAKSTWAAFWCLCKLYVAVRSQSTALLALHSS